MTLWRVLTVGPTGLPLVVEVRAASEMLALQKVTYWKPTHTIARDASGNWLIERRPTAA